MADHVTTVFRNGDRRTDESPCRDKYGVTQFEISGDGLRKVVFYTNPDISYLECRNQGQGEFWLHAYLSCLFSEPEDIKLIVIFRRGVIREIRGVGEEGFLSSWRNGKLKERSFKVLDEVEPHDEDLFEKFVISNLSFTKLTSSQDPPLRMSFAELEGDGGLTPVFHVLTRLTRGDNPDEDETDCESECERSRLEAYGFAERVDENAIVQLALVPESVFLPLNLVSKGVREWFLVFRNLPDSWGRSVWNTVLNEQVRVTEIDVRNSSLFSPVLSEIGNASFGWDLLFKVKEDLSAEPVTLALRLQAWGDDPEAEPPLRARFPLLRGHQGEILHADLPLATQKPLFKEEARRLDSEDFRKLFEEPGLSLNLGKKRAVTASSGPSLRIGALDIRFLSSSPVRVSDRDPELRWVLVPSRLPGSEEAYQAEQILVDLDWAVADVVPGGQDDLSGEFYADCDEELLQAMTPRDEEERRRECKLRRERPLIVPLPRKPDAKPQPLILNVIEQTRMRDTRRIDLRLRLPSGTTPAPAPSSGDVLKDVCSQEAETRLDRVAVLDREPFLVAKVSFPTLGSLKDPAAGNEVANWQSYGPDAGAWHIGFPDAQSFCLTLPAQGVGEEMEKRKKDQHGPAEGARADFRLSPPALLAMRETFFRQNFPEAPWNLRRLLSDPSRELPGAHLEHLQYELLYGLSCRVDYPFMRLAELSALVGDVMGPLPRKPAWVPLEKQGGVEIPDDEAIKFYKDARDRWAGTSRRTRQRLGIFELWDIRRLDTLELKDNVTCWIRHADPNKVPDELITVKQAEITDPFQPMDGLGNQGKLKGGVTWGFESRNVYGVVVRDGPNGKWPKSSGAEMKDTRLSALGGYGHQMAAFDNWRTKILADVSMGRTYSYTLERTGRIAVWWNRAKHVIIYERTVVPSRQFGALDPNHPDAQNVHAGRTVLRKVEEYVEILQNNRKYPDKGKGDSKATGFLTECSFSGDPNQVVRFRVLGSWGADVGNEGWKIPIWRPGQTPKDLYPKPVVNLTVMASVDGKSEPRKVTIADPENLFFYTDTTVKPEALENPSVDLSNTDEWDPVEGVDFVDQARPEPARDKAFASGSLRQTSAGDTVLPVGFRPCTFMIEPAEHTVDLLANRRGDPMGALLSSVTMCRASFQDFQGDKQGLSSIVDKARSFVADKIKEQLDFLPADARRFDASDLQRRLDQVCQRMGGEVEKLLEEPTARLQEGNDRLQQIGQSIDKLVQQLDEQATEKITSEARRLAAFPRQAVLELQNQKDELKKALRREMEQARALMALAPSPAAYLATVEATLQEAQQRFMEAGRQYKQIADQNVDGWFAAGRLPELIQRLRSYRETLQSISQRIRGLADSGAALRNGDRNVALGLGPHWVAKKVNLNKIADAVAAADAVLASAERIAAGAQDLKDFAKSRLARLAHHQADLNGEIDRLGELLKRVRVRILEAEEKRRERFKAFTEEVLRLAETAINSLPPDQLTQELRTRWEASVTSQAEIIRKGVNDDMAAIRSAAQEYFTGLDFKDLIPDRVAASGAVGKQCGELKKRFEALVAEIGSSLGIEEKLAEVRSFLERQRDEALRQIEEELGGGIKTARQLLGVVESRKDDVLKLVRAFGEPPEVSGLKFDRPEVAFFYDEIKDRVNVTPVIARAAQAAAIVEALKPFGIDLPVKELGEQLIPEELRNFDLSSILPNIAGIPLQNLFSGLKMPEGSGDAVKVRHGVDRQTRRAWVNTEVNFQAKENATLFAVGPLAVRINQPHFKAEARMEANLEGIQKKRVSGQLTGDWLLQIGGFPLITFKQTPLDFDEAGRVNFRVDPKNVQLAPALDFINDLLTTISPGGLTIRFDGDGVVSTLDLPIPDTQLGAFGFSSLRLGAALALRYSSGDFNIGVTASLGRRDAPFTLTVFILGGAGYLELGSRYHPSTGKVVAMADMAIAVSASLAIALGPIRGGVAVYLGVTAQYDSARGGGLVVGLMFMIRGHVSVLSIASATITLRLDGQYQGGAMVGRGHLEIKIKICWCFTLEVSESVTYTLGRVGSRQRALLGGPQPVVQIASLHGLPAFMAEAPAALEINQNLLTKGVDAYLNMLV